MKTPDSLPEGFEDLQPFVAHWAAPTSDARMRRRIDSRPEERQAFYDSARPLLVPAMQHLDGKPVDALNPADATLLEVMLAFAHVAHSVEMQRSAEPIHAAAQKHFTIERSSIDYARPGRLPSATR